MRAATVQGWLSADRPLVHPWVAATCLRLPGHDAVLARIEDGRIAWAFNLARPGSRRREVRVFWRCLLDGEEGVANRTEAEVYAEIIPPRWEAVRAASLSRRWSCGSELVVQLAPLMAIAAPSRRGANGSAQFTRASVIEFLRARRLGFEAEETTWQPARRSVAAPKSAVLTHTRAKPGCNALQCAGNASRTTDQTPSQA